jgi:ribonuclease J
MLISGPEVVSRGFVYVREAEELMDQAKEIAKNAIEECLDRGIDERSEIKNSVKNSLSRYILQTTGRKPMILPIIMDV